MNESCCSLPAQQGDRSLCPANGSRGQPVDWTTVAALTHGTVPPRQAFRLCHDADCEVVYYGSAGAVLTVGDLDVQPGFKKGSDGLLCYCFLHREADIVRQLTETGRTDIFESIRAEVEAGNCACEVRNPAGKCCLGDVRETIRGLTQEPGVRP